MSRPEHSEGRWEWLPRLFPSLRIAVIHSAEPAHGSVLYRTHQTRPWKSYVSVASDIQAALKRLGFQHVSLMDDGMELPRRLLEQGIHLVWLNTGGIQGYGSMSQTPALLEMLGMPYIGHDPVHAGILDNKHLFKRMLSSAGIRTAPFMVWDGSQERFSPPASWRTDPLFEGPAPSFVVKPVSGRASVNVHFVESLEGLAETVERVYARTLDLVLIERYLPGREYCVSVKGPVLGSNGRLSDTGGPLAFSVLERCLGPDERIFTSMDVKPLAHDRARLLGAGEEARQQELCVLGRRIYQELTLHHLIRLDVREDARGHLHVLEANPKPDLKRPTGDNINLVCLGMEALGMSYEDLLLSMIAERLEFLLLHRAESVAHLVSLLR